MKGICLVISKHVVHPKLKPYDVSLFAPISKNSLSIKLICELGNCIVNNNLYLPHSMVIVSTVRTFSSNKLPSNTDTYTHTYERLALGQLFLF